MQTILVVDDDESVRETIGVLLERENFSPIFAGDGRTGFDKALTLRPQLILIDLRLPGISGAELCKQLRGDRIFTPIIVLSAVGEEIDKVLLLEMGADDYIVKPFGARELLARIRALLRRSSADTKIVRFADVEVDADRRSTTRRGNEVNLRPAEYNLLLYFLQNPDRALTRDVI